MSNQIPLERIKKVPIKNPCGPGETEKNAAPSYAKSEPSRVTGPDLMKKPVHPHVSKMHVHLSFFASSALEKAFRAEYSTALLFALNDFT